MPGEVDEESEGEEDSKEDIDEGSAEESDGMGSSEEEEDGEEEREPEGSRLQHIASTLSPETKLEKMSAAKIFASILEAIFQYLIVRPKHEASIEAIEVNLELL